MKRWEKCISVMSNGLLYWYRWYLFLVKYHKNIRKTTVNNWMMRSHLINRLHDDFFWLFILYYMCKLFFFWWPRIVGESSQHFAGNWWQASPSVETSWKQIMIIIIITDNLSYPGRERPLRHKNRQSVVFPFSMKVSYINDLSSYFFDFL